MHWGGVGGNERLEVLITNLRQSVKARRCPWQQTLSSYSLKAEKAEDHIQSLIIREVSLQKYVILNPGKSASPKSGHWLGRSVRLWLRMGPSWWQHSNILNPQIHLGLNKASSCPLKASSTHFLEHDAESSALQDKCHPHTPLAGTYRHLIAWLPDKKLGSVTV